jgi:hypothetical protein
VARYTAVGALALVAGSALVLGNSTAGGDRSRIRDAPDEMQLLLEDLLELTTSSDDHPGDFLAVADPFDDAELFFEENATDGDLGIQVFLDGPPWERIAVFTPYWTRLVDVKVKGNAKVIGLTEIFSESAEPSYDELPREEFLALFPEGDYLMLGKTVEGDWLISEATLTHDLPTQPEIVSPQEDEEVDPCQPFTIEWILVADPDPPCSVIEAYEVILSKEHPGEPVRTLSIDMLSTDTSITISQGFLEPGKEYKVEILALESSGNKVITEVPFVTAE